MSDVRRKGCSIAQCTASPVTFLTGRAASSEDSAANLMGLTSLCLVVDKNNNGVVWAGRRHDMVETIAWGCVVRARLALEASKAGVKIPAVPGNEIDSRRRPSKIPQWRPGNLTKILICLYL